MKKALWISILLIISQGCTPSPPEIICEQDTNQLIRELSNVFYTDEIHINSMVLKEEMYFPAIIAFEINLINPTTKTLDFKQLDSIQYIGFENYEEIESSLKMEAEQLLEKVNQNCELTDFTSIIVNFTRKIDKYDLKYSFSNHLELKDYIDNHKKRIN